MTPPTAAPTAPTAGAAVLPPVYDPEHKTAGVFEPALLARLWAYVRPHRVLVMASLGLLLLTQGAGLLYFFLLRHAIDEHLAVARIEGIQWVLAGLVAVSATEYVARRKQVWLLDLAGQEALLDLRKDLFRHLQSLSSSFYDRTPIGKLVGRVTSDIEALQEMFSSGVVTILGDFVLIVALVVFLLVLDAELAAVSFLVVPCLLGITLWIRAKVRRAYQVMTSRRSRMNAFLHEHVSGMALVQSFGRERLATTQYGAINGELRDAQLDAVRWESLLSALTDMLGAFTTALITWYGARLIVGDIAAGATPGLTFGTLFLFVVWMQRFFQPLTDLSLKYTVMQSAMTAAERIFRLMDVDEKIRERPDAAAPAVPRGAVEFDRVEFAYTGGDRVLHGLSFRIAPGEKVAIVGATGSGKSTVLKLLTRLYDAQEGAIRLDGVDVRDYPVAELRRRVGVVLQDVFLFEGTILDNLRLGHPEITPEQAIAAADRLHLDRIVGRFPRGYLEPVAERGKNLSSGERQLVSFARALAVAPPVLVLDEATSNVDTRTEALLQGALAELIKGRTALIIAHRLSTIRGCDRILVLDGGRLVEEGRHEELLARGGRYKALHDLQYREHEPRPAR
jgi:ATP-binding cassette, subfamily B, multidrug efflux pump